MYCLSMKKAALILYVYRRDVGRKEKKARGNEGEKNKKDQEKERDERGE